MSLEGFLQDLRFGLRYLSRRPAASLVIILVLGLGIGANAAMFSIVSAVLLKPLPYKDSERLVLVWQSTSAHRNTGEWFNTYREFQQWREKSRSFEKLAALSWATGPKSLAWRGKKQKILAIPTSLDFFSMLGVAAAQGRTFEQADLQQGCTAVLAHAFWQNELGAPADLVGRDLPLDDKECRVVGVMPKGFSFYPSQTSLWMLMTPDSPYGKDPWRSVTGVFGRLQPGISREAAQSELEVLEKNVLGEAPSDLALPRNALPVVLDLQTEFTWLAGRNLRLALIVLLAAVFFVLLIACVNVANLLLAQAADRQRELAIRASLGCGRGRLIRQLLVESMILAVAGAGAGIAMAVTAVRVFAAHSPVELPPGNTVKVNWQVMAFTAILAGVTALLFGLVPAWRSSRPDINEALKDGGRSLAGREALRTRSVLVAGEVGLSLVLLAGAGLLLESLGRLASTPLGFRTDHLLTAALDLPDQKYATPDQKLQFFDKLKGFARSIPGVEQASLSSSIYLAGSYVLAVEGQPFSLDRAAHNVAQQTIDPGYLRNMDIPLLHGREFETRDRDNTQAVAIVNQALADAYFPRQNPIGRQIKLGKPESKQPWLTIVGVAGNVKTTTVFQEMGYVVSPAVYRPLAQLPPASVALLLRTNGDPNALAKPVQNAVRGLDDEITLSDLKTMEERLRDLRAEPRFRTILLSSFAGLALVLAALGIYGLLMQSVVRRTKEIGIRMALGASRQNVVRVILLQAFTTVFAGICSGLAATLILVRFIGGLLYDVHPQNPLMLAAVSIVLILTSAFACFIPARRATTVDPLQALRSE